MSTNNKEYQILVKTFFGLEEVLENELLNIGANDVKKLNRAVSAIGDLSLVYKCNLLLRTALSVYVKIKSGKVDNNNDLYKLVKSINWDSYFSVDKSIAVEAVTFSKNFKHSKFVEQKTKDGIVDFFREKKGKRPDVNLKQPDVKIYIHISGSNCSIYFNSSGESLYYRGYNKITGKAPLNDVLAAGMVLLSGWDKKSPFYDFMCGCGTIIIEAMMVACNIPPTMRRKSFSFMNWLNYDSLLWSTIFNSAIEKIKNNSAYIIGADIDSVVISYAEKNLDRLYPKHNVTLHNKDFFKINPDDNKGTVIINPPYGMRYSNENIIMFYKNLGKQIKFNYDGYKFWILSSEKQYMKLLGLKPDKKLTLFNGALECSYNKYKIYSGAKKNYK